jgi:hypothetical protein
LENHQNQLARKMILIFVWGFTGQGVDVYRMVGRFIGDKAGQEDLLAEFTGQVLLTAPVGRRRDDGGGVAGRVISIGGVPRL